MPGFTFALDEPLMTSRRSQIFMPYQISPLPMLLIFERTDTLTLRRSRRFVQKRKVGEFVQPVLERRYMSPLSPSHVASLDPAPQNSVELVISASLPANESETSGAEKELGAGA